MSDPGEYCEPGFYCEIGETDIFANPCEPGNYCQPGANVGENGMRPCAEGTYQPNEVMSYCYDCPAGYYCPGTGNTEPTICPEGYYCA